MTTTQHTPGPWRVCNSRDIFPDDNDREGRRYIAHIGPELDLHYCDLTFDECKANAQLIAAAPDLLEATEFMLLLYDETRTALHTLLTGGDKMDEMADKALAALAKARGQDSPGDGTI